MLKLRGLYYITHVKNLPSILDKGILSHKKIEEEGIKSTPIYDEEIVSARKEKITPDGRSLWDFVNLYFQPRNAMLYRVTNGGEESENIIIIGLKTSILERNDVFITDGNAANSTTKFYSSKESKKHIKDIRKKTDREWWNYGDDSKREMMAECLIPEKVAPDYISEIYVSSATLLITVRNICKNIPVIPNPELFFLPTRKINLTETLSLVEGDMFFSRMQTLTISVNTVGVMGKGLASRAKYQFPDVYVKYQDLCKSKKLRMGKPYLYKRKETLDLLLADEPSSLNNASQHTWFLLFPTKRHWREKADLEGIKKGLEWLVANYKREGIESLAIPALGCGLGWLKWESVGPILCRYLQKLEIYVNLYLPLERKIPEEQLSKDFLLK